MSNPLSTSNMAALVVIDGQKYGERYLAIPCGLTHEQAVSWVAPYLGTLERIAGFYVFGGDRE